VGVEIVEKGEEGTLGPPVHPAEEPPVDLCRVDSSGLVAGRRPPEALHQPLREFREAGPLRHLGEGEPVILIVLESAGQSGFGAHVFGIGHDAHGGITRFTQHFRQGGKGPVEGDLPVDRELLHPPAGEEARMGRRGPGRRGEGLVEGHPACRNVVQVGRCRRTESVESELDRPDGIEDDQQDVGTLPAFASPA
jgi:hypothetical protein